MQAPKLTPELKAQILHKGKKGFSGEERPATSAEQAHQRSQFVLNELASPWPSVAEMKKSARSDWTIPAVKHRIIDLKREHRQQLAKAIKYQEHEHLQMINDEYSGFDTMADWSTNFTEEVKSFLRMEHHLHTHQSDDFISSLRYSHIVALKPLYEKLQQLLVLEEDAKQKRAKKFPKSSQGWREMDTRDAKFKVAQFLQTTDKRTRNEMLLREADWDRTDVDRVVLEFSTNIVFSEEVKNFVKENQTTDPRRRGL